MYNLQKMIGESWSKISPFWSIQNLIATNPLKGFEALSIEEALLEGQGLFESNELPKPMDSINRESIKWMQCFCDEGVATIKMPGENKSFYHAWKMLAYFDDNLHGGNEGKKKWILDLPDLPEEALLKCFEKLKIPFEHQKLFVDLMLTSLSGWSSYLKYRIDFSEVYLNEDKKIDAIDYVAFRVVITTLLWDNAADLVKWHHSSKKENHDKKAFIKTMEKKEAHYQKSLLQKIPSELSLADEPYKAQLVFCIDTRSESFRKNLENVGGYQTFGFAGFFGLPIYIEKEEPKKKYVACPVLLKPAHTVCEISVDGSSKENTFFNALIKGYQSLKYNVATPFCLVDFAGISSAILMIMDSFFHKKSVKTKKEISIESIPLAAQADYAESMLKTIGLTNGFSSLVLLCGHTGKVKNNAYSTGLDCGACSGQNGFYNALILVTILNDQHIRSILSTKGIFIPKTTLFLAAEHNTTTDEVYIHTAKTVALSFLDKIEALKLDLNQSSYKNSKIRAEKMGFYGSENQSKAFTNTRSLDWSEVRPEWALARNASFIIGPRSLTHATDLEGRSFLHSYDYKQDLDGNRLSAIMNGPVIVAQLINSQYFFSTMNNVAYGSGSKVTQNITGKIGIMQGNASDLMHGLPLQSVFINDKTPYHDPIRLLVVICAPMLMIDKLLQKEQNVQKLFRNGWMKMVCIDPNNLKKKLFLNRDLTWGNI